MKKITVIGMGTGEKTLTAEAADALRRADVLIGAQRMLAMYKGPRKRSYPDYLPENVCERVMSEDASEFAVLVSGDAGFFSAAKGICEALPDYPVRLVPGVSTVNAFFARLKLPWQDAAFLSVHGRNANVADTVRRNRYTFCLTGGNAGNICAELCGAGLGAIKTYIGENIGMEGERVWESAASQLANAELSPLTVLLFINEWFDDRIYCGLPDACFERIEGIPMTKSEIRAIVMSRLNIRPDYVCYDIGAGTGSVTSEMALAAYRGHVYAIERHENALKLIKRNCRNMRIGNVTAICGDAPCSLETLPSPDAVFIGGNGGQACSIISAVMSKNPNARIVMTAITLETVSLALQAFDGAGLEPEIVQLSVSRGKRVGSLHMLNAQNPVTIFSAGGIGGIL